jgi:hypothetical protein
VRFVLRACLVSALIGTLVSLPVAGATSERPLGTVTQSSSAKLDSAVVAVGATVYPGDTIETDSAGSIRLRAGTAQFYLMSGSSSRLQESPNGIHAELLRGAAGFASGPANPVELSALGATVRSRSGEAVHGRVTIVGSNELVVTSFRGPFEISIDGDTHTIDDGQAYRVQIVDQDQTTDNKPVVVQTGGNGSQTIPAVRNRKKLLLVMLYSAAAAGAIVGGYFIYHELDESPYRPHR